MGHRWNFMEGVYWWSEVNQEVMESGEELLFWCDLGKRSVSYPDDDDDDNDNDEKRGDQGKNYDGDDAQCAIRASQGECKSQPKVMHVRCQRECFENNLKTKSNPSNI